MSKTTFKIIILTLALLPGFANAEVIREKIGVDIKGDFVLEPAKNEVVLLPGENSTKKLSIINRMNKSVNFKITVEDIVGSDNVFEQVKLLGDEKGPYSLKDFIIPEITEFTLDSGEKITIPVEVSLPEDSEPRGYYGALIVSSEGEESGVGSGNGAEGVTKIVTRLGSIFLVKVDGELNQLSSLKEFKAIGPKKMFYGSHPRGFEVAVKNQGSVHLVHYGEVKIKNILGKEVKSLPINAFFSLPDSTRYREIQWPMSFALGFYKAEVGLYRGYGEESGLLNQSFSFVVLPWKILLTAFIVAALILLLVRYIKNNFKIERK